MTLSWYLLMVEIILIAAFCVTVFRFIIFIYSLIVLTIKQGWKKINYYFFATVVLIILCSLCLVVIGMILNFDPTFILDNELLIEATKIKYVKLQIIFSITPLILVAISFYLEFYIGAWENEKDMFIFSWKIKQNKIKKIKSWNKISFISTGWMIYFVSNKSILLTSKNEKESEREV
jgi:hypothetical protein